MILPWGKFKGKDLEDIPSGYLKWLSENCEDDEIANAAYEEYEWRSNWDKHWWD